MPLKAKPQDLPGRKAITRSVSGLTPHRLRYLAQRQAAREAARGLPVNADRIEGRILDELVYREYCDEQRREQAEAEATDA